MVKKKKNAKDSPPVAKVSVTSSNPTIVNTLMSLISACDGVTVIGFEGDVHQTKNGTAYIAFQIFSIDVQSLVEQLDALEGDTIESLEDGVGGDHD